MIEAYLPNSLNPAAGPGGSRVTFTEIGPVNVSASQPKLRNQFATYFAPKAARLFWRTSSSFAYCYEALLMALCSFGTPRMIKYLMSTPLKAQIVCNFATLALSKTLSVKYLSKKTSDVSCVNCTCVSAI